MTDYAVKVSVRNGRVLRAMRDEGFGSIAALARATGLRYEKLVGLVGMKIPARHANGEWRDAALRVSSVLGAEPEELFNEQQQTTALEHNSAEVFMDAEQVAALTAPSGEQDAWAKIEVDNLLEYVTPREREIVKARLAGATLAEIAEEVGVCSQRVREIEMRARRKMRYAVYRTDSNVALGRPAIKSTED